MTTYPIAPNGIYWTIQGEGPLLGKPMRFVRLAGCSVGCPECDTNYTVAERMSVGEICERLDRLPQTGWTWVTGGEPLDHNLNPLLESLRLQGRVAVCTSGHAHSTLYHNYDYLHVSPHGKPADLKVLSGSVVNLVPGLNGLDLNDWLTFDGIGFRDRYVTPCEGKPETVAQCIEWVKTRPTWRLGVQAHKSWGIA